MDTLDEREAVIKINDLRDRAMALRSAWGGAYRAATQLQHDRVERRLLKAGADGEKALEAYERHDWRQTTLAEVGLPAATHEEVSAAVHATLSWSEGVCRLVATLTMLRGWAIHPRLRERALTLGEVAGQAIQLCEQALASPHGDRYPALPRVQQLLRALPDAPAETWLGPFVLADRAAERVLRGES